MGSMVVEQMVETENEAQIKAECDAEKEKQEEDSRQKAEADAAKEKQEEEARLKAEAEAAKDKLEEEARLKSEAEAAKAKQEEEIKQKAEAEKAKQEHETRLKAEEAKQKAEAEAVIAKQEEEAKQKAEAENAKQEEEERLKAEAGASKVKQDLKADVKPAPVGDGSSALNVNVLVVGARNLEKSGMFGKADPYIVVSHKDKKKTSTTINNDLNPQWNFENTFAVSNSSKETLRFEVYDKDTVTKDDLMGSTEISITDAAQMKEGSWIPLQGCKSGELFVSVEVYQPKTGEDVVASEGLEDSKSQDTDVTEAGNKIVEDAAALTLAAEAAEAQRK